MAAGINFGFSLHTQGSRISKTATAYYEVNADEDDKLI